MHWMVRVIRRGVNGVEKAVYTEKCRARAFTQLSPGQPSALCNSQWWWDGPGCWATPHYQAPKLDTRSAHSTPALGEWILNLLTMVFENT